MFDVKRDDQGRLMLRVWAGSTPPDDGVPWRTRAEMDAILAEVESTMGNGNASLDDPAFVNAVWAKWNSPRSADASRPAGASPRRGR